MRPAVIPVTRQRLLLTALTVAAAGSFATVLLGGSQLKAAVVIAGGCTAILAAVLLTGDYLSPPVLWLFAWTCGLCVGQLDVYLRGDYVGEWTPALWLALLGSSLAFCLGSALVLRLGLPTRPPQAVPWDPRRLSRIIVACFVVGVATYVFTVIVRGGIGQIPLFSNTPARARQNFGIRGTSYFLLLLAMPPILAVPQFLVGGGWRRNKLTLLLATVAVALFITTADRSIALETLAIAFLTHAVANGLKPVRTLAALTTAVAIFIVVGVARQVANPNDTLLFSTAYVGIQNPLLAMAYLYFGTAYGNLQHVLATVQEFNYGGVLLRAPLHAIGLGGLSQPQPINWNAWNTATALADFFYDFGWFGVLAIPFVLGIVISRLYVRARATLDPLYLVLYGIAAECVLVSITTDRFFEGTTLLYATVALVAGRLCRRAPRTGSAAAELASANSATTKA